LTLISHQDITERKSAMEALRQSEEELGILDRIGATLASELDFNRSIRSVTYAGRELSHAELEHFLLRHG
jgi:hypothetical protein